MPAVVAGVCVGVGPGVCVWPAPRCVCSASELCPRCRTDESALEFDAPLATAPAPDAPPPPPAVAFGRGAATAGAGAGGRRIGAGASGSVGEAAGVEMEVEAAGWSSRLRTCCWRKDERRAGLAAICC